MRDVSILSALESWLAEPKLGLPPTGWHDGNRAGAMEQVIPIEVARDGLDEARVVLTANRRRPNADVSAILIARLDGSDFRLLRLDWRPPRPHRNRCGPVHLVGVTSWTGIHPFTENAALGLSRMMAENLPVCMPLEPEPPDFQALVECLCAMIDLTLTETIASPPW